MQVKRISLAQKTSRGANLSDARRRVNEGTNALISKFDDGKSVFYLDIGRLTYIVPITLHLLRAA